MDTLITAVVSIIAGAIMNEILRYFVPVWKKSVKNSLPKKRSSKERMKIIIKYPFLTAAICLIFFLVPEGKWFVVSVCAVCVVICFFISRDMLSYSLHSFTWSMEKDSLQKELEKWTNQLAKCDPKDNDRIEMIKSKLSDLNKQLKGI